MKPSLDDRGSHDPLDLIDRLDCGSLSRMHLLALACCPADFAFDLAERGVAGFGLGAFPALMIAYLTDVLLLTPGRLGWGHRVSVLKDHRNDLAGSLSRLCVGLYLPALSIYVTEMFPTKSCSTLTSVAWPVS